MNFNEYLEKMLGKKGAQEVKRANKHNKVIIISGPYQTGKSTLTRVLRSHGFNAVEDEHEAHVIRLKKAS